MSVDVATVAIGSVELTSVQGTPLALTVDPLRPTCMLALPSHGIGHYRFAGQPTVENIASKTIAYIPGSRWQLLNDQTGGTALHFTKADLIRRIQSIAPCAADKDHLDSAVLEVLLCRPFAISVDSGPASHRYAQLLCVLSFVDDLFRQGMKPDPMLCLDDLLTRCVALLLLPELAAQRHAMASSVGLDGGTSAAVVETLMEWMIANLHRPLSLSEIEARSHYSRRAIQLAFKTKVGCGPMQWLRQQRLDQARQLLSTPAPSTTITSVAHRCGYLSLASFSRDFRDRFQLSPSEMLREAALRMAD